MGPKAGVRELPGADLDLAVAAGAAYYGLVRRGKGIRIRGGTARAYYVGVESSLPAVPGAPPPIKALCVVPFGMEEGTEADVPAQEFGLVVGEPAEFRFLGSRPGAATIRRHARRGMGRGDRRADPDGDHSRSAWQGRADGPRPPA